MSKNVREGLIPAKIVLIGPRQSGKTSFIIRFVNQTFSDLTMMIFPISSDGIFLRKLILIDYRHLKLSICDPSREERPESFYLNNADAVVILFSVTDRSSFEAVESYLGIARKESPADTHVILVGNKCDVKEGSDGKEKREVGYDEAQAFARTHGLEYIETSSKEDINVAKAFEMIAKERLRRYDNAKSLEPEPCCSIF